MEFISALALVLLTLVGYSSGAVLAAKYRWPAPAPLDLLVVIVLWALALLSQPSLGRWVAISVWLFVALAASFVLAVARRGPAPSKAKRTLRSEAHRTLLARSWDGWRKFARQLGNYQGRVILAFFYFVVLTPFGLLTRLLSDPLQIRSKTGASLWAERPADAPGLDGARRQF